MRGTWLIAGIAGCLFIAQAAQAKELRIGVVDMQRAVSETNEGKKAEAELRKTKQRLEAELNRKLKEIYDEQARLQKAASVLTEEQKRKKVAEARKKLEDLQKQYMEAERQLMSQKTKAMMKITNKLGKIIEDVAKREKFDYIFNNAAILWAPRHVDLTNEVIRRYNK